MSNVSLSVSELIKSSKISFLFNNNQFISSTYRTPLPLSLIFPYTIINVTSCKMATPMSHVKPIKSKPIGKSDKPLIESASLQVACGLILLIKSSSHRLHVSHVSCH